MMSRTRAGGEMAPRVSSSAWMCRRSGCSGRHPGLADAYRAGNILLAGDAAHVHSPAGGQGMNTGIQDGVALGRLRVSALRTGDDAALDDYQRTRRPVAAQVVAFTDRMTRMATLRTPRQRALRNTALRAVGHLPMVRARLATQMAGLHLR
jgi:2-polyprenyl-6-methoxyphenol hydroxylase-like FAD-dependent oxidoreductase